MSMTFHKLCHKNNGEIKALVPWE